MLVCHSDTPYGNTQLCRVSIRHGIDSGKWQLIIGGGEGDRLVVPLQFAVDSNQRCNMAKKRSSKPSNFVLRIRALPPDAQPITNGEGADGTRIYTDIEGNIFAVRTEQVVYRLLGPAGGMLPPNAPAKARRRSDG